MKVTKNLDATTAEPYCQAKMEAQPASAGAQSNDGSRRPSEAQDSDILIPADTLPHQVRRQMQLSRDTGRAVRLTEGAAPELKFYCPESFAAELGIFMSFAEEQPAIIVERVEQVCAMDAVLQVWESDAGPGETARAYARMRTLIAGLRADIEPYRLLHEHAAERQVDDKEKHRRAFRLIIGLKSLEQLQSELPIDKCQRARLFCWESFMLRTVPTLAELAVIATLYHADGAALPGHKQFCRTALAGETVGNRQLVDEFSRLISQDPQARDIFAHILRDEAAQKASDAQLWAAYREQALAPVQVIQRLKELEAKIDFYRRELPDLLRHSHGGLTAPRASLLEMKKLVPYAQANVQEAYRQLSASGIRTTSKFLCDEKISEMRSMRTRGQRADSLSAEAAGAPLLGGKLEYQFDSSMPVAEARIARLGAVAKCGQAACLAVDSIARIYGLNCEVIIGTDGCVPMPDKIAACIDQVANLADKERHPWASPPNASQLQQLEELKQMALFVDTESRANGSLSKRVQALVGRLPILNLLRQRLDVVAAECSKASAPTPKQGTGKKKNKSHRRPSDADNAGPQSSNAATTSQGASPSQGESLPEHHALAELRSTLQEDLAGQPKGGQSPWQEISSAGRAELAAARAVFGCGTFPSAIASARYHFRKHAAELPGATLTGYIERAREACRTWQAAWSQGIGHLEPAISRVGTQVRVVSASDLWLVHTDEEEPKVLSYRDRKRQAF